jgi:glucosamine 6-phosphate synthetase-like amidotransferase/phosphosugar isomerase protein
VQHLWVFISQSGQTGVLKRVMASLQAFCSDVTEASHHVLVLTNQSEARLTQDARIHQGSLTHVWEWAYQAGAEQAIAATKSVTCSLLSGLALIHHLVADVSVSLLSSALFPSLEESQVLHSALQRLYAPFKSPLALVKPSIPSEVILLGHTRDEGLLHEVGLKWIEMAGLHPIVLNTETFQHGYKALCTARPQLHDHRGYPAVYLWLPEEATARNQVLQDIEHLQVQGVLPALPASSPDDIAFTRRTEHTHTALPAPSDTKQLHHYHGIDATHWCACFPSTYFAEASFPRFARESLSLLLWGQWMAEYFRLQVQAPPDALPGLEKVVQ